MAHHKKGKRQRNARAGCKLCKPWKASGQRRGNANFEKFTDWQRRVAAERDQELAISDPGAAERIEAGRRDLFYHHNKEREA